MWFRHFFENRPFLGQISPIFRHFTSQNGDFRGIMTWILKNATLSEIIKHLMTEYVNMRKIRGIYSFSLIFGFKKSQNVRGSRFEKSELANRSAGEHRHQPTHVPV